MSQEHPVIAPKKLIEVALPLDAINAACAREKSIRQGHPSTLHLWWARRPLASARAVIFSQMVNDPEDIWKLKNPGKEPNKQERGHWTKARKKLFEIIEDLVKWENTTNEEVLERAREEIRKSWRETCELNKFHPQAAELFNPGKLPGLHDPFAGGGAIPLEAQRLGLEAYASDLNPVAVLINKAMIEIPPKFVGCEPVNPEWQSQSSEEKAMRVWKGAEGLAEDVQYYGKWMRGEAEKQIGNLYPKVEVTAEMANERPDLRPLVGQRLTVIVWVWARIVRSPSPAFSHVEVPLVSTFYLSSKAGKEAYVEPVVGKDSYRFRVRMGKSPNHEATKSGTKLARGAHFRCLVSGAAIEPDYIKAEAVAGRMGDRLMAIIAETDRTRVYLDPSDLHESVAVPDGDEDAREALHVPLAYDPRNLWCLRYGLDHFDSLFSRRQLHALDAFCGLVKPLLHLVSDHASRVTAQKHGCNASADYADAIATYMGLAIGRSANYWSALTPWGGEFVVQTFGRQAIPMVWDHAEVNVFSQSTGNWLGAIEWIQRVLQTSLGAGGHGVALQCDAQAQVLSSGKIVSTDPPYYDNIIYSDLADFFYVWLRHSLRECYPALFATRVTPKEEELVACPYRHPGAQAAEKFFERGMTEAFRQVSGQTHPAFPVTVYYAFKQAESDGNDQVASTGWDTFLSAVLNSGLTINGTWPMRTERDQGLKTGTNVLASSVILVCRSRPVVADTVSRRQFIRELNAILPQALDSMTRQADSDHSPVAPVDLSQAIIGPGMAVFSRYKAVLEADGTPMSVKTALQLINRFLAEDDFDADTQFCLHWFEQHCWEKGKFGEADTLARAKGTSVDGVRAAGVIESGGGHVRLLRWSDYASDWDPAVDERVPVWEALHQLVRVFKSGGESAAGKLLAGVASQAEPVRQLAYRLYTLCERAGWADDARAYNELITSWAPIEAAAASSATGAQKTLFD